jgi:hypothetical protein
VEFSHVTCAIGIWALVYDSARGTSDPVFDSARGTSNTPFDSVLYKALVPVNTESMLVGALLISSVK